MSDKERERNGQEGKEGEEEEEWDVTKSGENRRYCPIVDCVVLAWNAGVRGPVLEEPTASYARSGDSLIKRTIGRLQSTLCTRAGRRRRQREATDTAPVYGDNASTKQLLSL